MGLICISNIFVFSVPLLYAQLQKSNCVAIAIPLKKLESAHNNNVEGKCINRIFEIFLFLEFMNFLIMSPFCDHGDRSSLEQFTLKS